MIEIQESELCGLLNYLVRQKEFVFLDTSRPDRENVESLLFLQPVARLVCRLGDDLDSYLSTLQDYLRRGYYLAGWVSYEFGALLEGRIEPDGGSFPGDDLALASLAAYSEPCRWNHLTGRHNFPLVMSEEEPPPLPPYTIENLHPNMAKEEFLEALERVRQYIVAGDTYQVNYTLKLQFDFTGSVENLYSVLRKNQSVAYGAYIGHGEERILSFSPELFFRKTEDEITVRPMKGTAAKGRNAEEEKDNGTRLHLDGKNRSENVMIVDLLRNDLARLIHSYGGGRVFAASLFDVESYESLLQMTSTIKASTAASVMAKIELPELFRALFPCGSITGAPKIRTMQIINELEKQRRGVYTGAIGYFAPDGSAVFNVPIRTIRLDGSAGEMGIGAGITHDSNALEEWRESLLKGRFLTHCQPDFQLLETLLWQPDTGYWLLAEHLQRLAGAARFFRFSCDLPVVRDRLLQRAALFEPCSYRVRLALHKDGRTTVEAVPCDPPAVIRLPPRPQPEAPGGRPTVEFSSCAANETGPWLFHKTTNRSWYDAEYRRAQQRGLYDVLFCNSRGDVTEGCITNLIVYRDGRYLTPPVACGLLAGVMRGHLLADTDIPLVEQRLSRQDIATAEAVYLCNSVRGVVRVEMQKEQTQVSG